MLVGEAATVRAVPCAPIGLLSRAQMPIHGGARHLQHVRDLRDGVFLGVVKALRECDLIRAELRGPAALTAAGAGGGQSVAGVGHYLDAKHSKSGSTLRNHNC